MKNFNLNEKEKVKSQYNDSRNLNARIHFHSRFSTNKYGWSNWIFDKFDFIGRTKLLELGCGNAQLWKSNFNRIPEGVHIVLSDFSEGMLKDAENNMDDICNNFEFKVIDCQCIPYNECEFDMVIANHMLYHVPNRGKALSEIARVLKTEGVFHATTIGETNMGELAELVCKYDLRIDYPINSVAYEFGIENGMSQLKEHFSDVKLLKYEDMLEVTEADPLVDYVLSSKDFGNLTDVITVDRRSDFKEYIECVLKRDGVIKIKKDAGMFIALK